MSYITNIIKKTQENTNFREVLFTGQKSQLVVMNIPVGGEIGEETHAHVEQTLFFLSGNAKAILEEKETEIGVGDVVVVSPGIKHNFINTGTEPVLVYTLYAPANHIDVRIHITKDDADSDVEDELFGESVKLINE